MLAQVSFPQENSKPNIETITNEIDFNQHPYNSLNKKKFNKKYLPSLKAALINEGKRCSFNTDAKKAYKLLQNCGFYLLHAQKDVFEQNILGYLSSAEQYGVPLIEEGLKEEKVTREQLDNLKNTIERVKMKQKFYNPKKDK